MHLQTRFSTVLLQLIQPHDLLRVVNGRAPDMAEDEAQRWRDSFFQAKQRVPNLTTRALLEALKTSVEEVKAASKAEATAET